MGQKDLAAKRFESSPEVFADIINAFIYEGEQVILPQNLQPAPTESLYSVQNGKLSNQYNDVSKYEIRNGKIVMQYTLENQSGPDYRILLRKAGYEGAIYRQQYNGKDTFPAVTLVLYWGDVMWNPSSDLYKFFRRKKIHRKARKYIDNVCLHLYSMKRLPWEIRQRFRSDMRMVVDYLAEGEMYEATDREIADLDAMIRMLYALTGETDFMEHLEFLQKRLEKGEKITMGYALTKYMERGREQGIQEGKREGKREGIKEEKLRCAEAFVAETVMQKQPKEYIIGMLQTCFRLKEEEAVNLYRKGVM